MGASSHTLDRVEVTFDGDRMVADAGLILPATLSQHLGVEALVDELTGAYNRRGVKTLAEHHLRMTRRTGAEHHCSSVTVCC